MKTSIFHYIIPLLLFVGCNSAPEQQQEANKEPKAQESVTLDSVQRQNAGIATGKIERKTLHDYVHANGKIDVPPTEMVNVTFPLGGYVQKMNIIPGMYVKKGQTLALLEDIQFIQLEHDYLNAKNQLAFLEKDYMRQKTLNAQQASSDKQFEQVKTDYFNQKVQVKSLAEKLKLIGINPNTLTENNLSRSVAVRAPINGYVTKVNISQGDYLTPTDVLFKLLSRDDLHVNLTVFEQDINKLHKGQKVSISRVEGNGKTYEATIFMLGQELDENRATPVHCHLEQFDDQLLPGMYVKAIISVTADSTIAVPETAVVRYNQKHYLYRENGKGQYERVEIETGIEDNGWVQLKNLPADFLSQSFVLKGAYSLLMQMENTEEE